MFRPFSDAVATRREDHRSSKADLEDQHRRSGLGPELLWWMKAQTNRPHIWTPEGQKNGEKEPAEKWG
jgi:hypothetical protein